VGLAVAGAKAADLSPAIVERLTEATVYIESHVVLAASDWQALPEAARKGLGKRPQGPASGSGFIIDKSGYILTNAHVVDTIRQTVTVGKEERELRFLPTEIHVVVRSGLGGEKSYSPQLVKLDAQADLALLKIAAQGELTALALKPLPDAQVGEAVLMAGFPGGKIPDQAPFAGGKKHEEALDKNPRVSINAGTVTALREQDRSLCYQLDIRANPGNSGGPIVNMAGEVIGVLNAGIRSMQSINYAIPARNFRVVLPASLTAAWPAEAHADGAAQSYQAFQASGTFKLAQ